MGGRGQSYVAGGVVRQLLVNAFENTVKENKQLK
jgi:hypothetical protein